MSALTSDLIRARVSSLLASAPFSFTPAPEPFNFERLPASLVDGSFCLESEGGAITGGSHYSESRIDLLRINVARLDEADVDACYRALLVDCTSITAAVVRDGAVLSGDYDVLDEGRGFSISHEPGRAYSILRLTLPVDYEAQL